MTNQNVFDLALRAVLGAALLVSPAYAATKPAISSIRLAAPAAGHIIARTPALTFSCSTATIAVNTVGRCGPVPAATINGSSSADAFTQPVRLNEANTFRCASSVVGAKTTDPLCAAKATVNRGFSADTLTKGSLRLNPPILVRCPPISIVPRPTPPWCTGPLSGTHPGNSAREQTRVDPRRAPRGPAPFARSHAPNSGTLPRNSSGRSIRKRLRLTIHQKVTMSGDSDPRSSVLLYVTGQSPPVLRRCARTQRTKSTTAP